MTGRKGGGGTLKRARPQPVCEHVDAGTLTVSDLHALLVKLLPTVSLVALLLTPPCSQWRKTPSGHRQALEARPTAHAAPCLASIRCLKGFAKS